MENTVKNTVKHVFLQAQASCLGCSRGLDYIRLGYRIFHINYDLTMARVFIWCTAKLSDVIEGYRPAENGSYEIPIFDSEYEALYKREKELLKITQGHNSQGDIN